MATTQLDRLGTAVGYPRLPAALGHARDVLARIAVIAFAALSFAGVIATAGMGVIYAAPIATSMVGLAGLLVVWVAAIGLIAASPRLVRSVVAAVTHA